MTIKPEGGGGKALITWPLVEDFFFAASLTDAYDLGLISREFWGRVVAVLSVGWISSGTECNKKN